MLDEMDISCEYSSNDKSNDEDDEDDALDGDMERLIELLPSVIQNLEKYGQAETFIKWCTLVSENRIPLDNICSTTSCSLIL